jgi:hypothetical protein
VNRESAKELWDCRAASSWRHYATARQISFAAAAREVIERGFSAKSNEGVAS